MVRSLVGNGLGVSVLTTRPVYDRSQDGARIACRRLRGTVSSQAVVLASPDAGGFRSPLAEPFAAVARAVFSARD